MKYKPDHIAVQWLNKSLDPAATFNYRTLGDMETLARLWGYQLSKAGESLDAAKRLLEQQKQSNAHPQIIARSRIELGKLYYLNKDQLNAGYQFWQARLLGADVMDLKRLTLDRLKGEIDAIAFEVAKRQGLEYITAFDYQGSEAGSEIWGTLLNELNTFSIKKKHRITEADPRWKELSVTFDREREAFEQKKDKRWEEKYGDIKEVREYINALDAFERQNNQMPKTRDGLAQMSWVQPPEYMAIERKVHTEVISRISINGLGKARTAGNWRRNELMMNFAEEDINRLGTRRVMIVVGFAHKFFLEDLLKKRGYRIVPSLDFIP